MMKTVFAAPKEINLEDIGESETFITISVLDQEYLDMLTDLTQLPSFERENQETRKGRSKVVTHLISLLFIVI